MASSASLRDMHSMAPLPEGAPRVLVHDLATVTVMNHGAIVSSTSPPILATSIVKEGPVVSAIASRS